MQLKDSSLGSLSRNSNSAMALRMYQDDFASEPVAEPAAIVKGANYRFTMIEDNVLRYEWAEDGVFEDRASTLAINRKFEPPAFRITETDGLLVIDTDTLRLTYNKQRFSSNGFSIVLKYKLNLWGSEWKYGSADGANLGGTARTLDTVNGRCDMGTGILSRMGFSALDDSHSMLFDGEGFVAPRRPGDRIDGYFFCYGHDYKGAMASFYAISGHQPVLPRWALGNWWSRYHRYTTNEYLGLMDQFADRKIPLSVAVIDMDWHLVDDERVPHTGWTGYTWDKQLFPDPVAFGKELHQRNLKITLNDHPHSGIHHHEDAYEDMAKALGHNASNKAPIEFDPTDPQFMKAYLQVLHRSIEQIACDFWWIDWQQGSESRIPGLDPLWLLNHFHYLDNAQEKPQPLIFSRYAGPGSHRYPVGFSGDTIATWDSLKFQPEFTATASNIGFGWWSHDLGGHMGGYRDDEMVARWIQYGVFSPILRLHSSNSQWTSKEPWLYRKDCQDTVEKWMKFRHRLVPYLYSLNVKVAETVSTLVQPMYWHHPKRDEAYEVPNQYYFGDKLMVAPIVEPRNPKTNLGSVSVWIPPGRHIDIFSGTVYDGDRMLTMYRPIDSLPVLAREGSIIPLDASEEPPNGCPNPTAYEVLVVVGADTSAMLREDPRDDARAEYSKGEQPKMRTAHLEYDQIEGSFVALIHGGHWKFVFLAGPPPDKITLRGKFDEGGSIDKPDAAYMKDGALHVEIKLPETEGGRHIIHINLGSHPQLKPRSCTEQIGQLLNGFQVDFAAKDKLWEILQRKQPKSTTATSYWVTGLGEDVIGPLIELICADSRRAED